ncbi:MAG TPA: lysophospholipid acyltransferase family protein [Candidatus Dormibacteraeota bacterium]|nr:lysophospholipid acyltransferase family protein [Candidatus Dormibacteraeota bacterium]
MADSTVVRGAPPAALARTFEAAATALRGMGRGRYVIADAAGALTYALQPPRKRRLCAELHSRAAGGLGAAEARRRARASYRSYARMIVDTLWIHAIGLDEMFEHGSIENVEVLHDARERGRGAVLVIAHFGSWDIAASLALAAGFPVSTVMAPVGPPWITELLAWSRKVKNMELFTPLAAARGLLRALREGRMIALLVDIPEGGPTTTVQFCNGPVDFSTGPAFFARRTGAPIIPAECWRTDHGYRLRFRDPLFAGDDDDATAVTQRVATILEERIRLIPEQWYPFNEIYRDRM